MNKTTSKWIFCICFAFAVMEVWTAQRYYGGEVRRRFIREASLPDYAPSGHQIKSNGTAEALSQNEDSGVTLADSEWLTNFPQIFFFAEIPHKNMDENHTLFSYYTFPSPKLFDILNISPDNLGLESGHLHWNSTVPSSSYEEHLKKQSFPKDDKGSSGSDSQQSTPESVANDTVLYIDLSRGRGKKFLRGRTAMEKLIKNIFGRPIHPTSLIRSNMRRLRKAIYPYYHRPKLRYPFYDEEGNGELLYGYGEDTLYKYEIFTPLQGYYR